MSYISVDLKAIEVFAPAVSRATGRPLQEILGGLVLLWHRCWSSKKNTITPIGVAGCFGPGGLDTTIAALVDSEFLSGGPVDFEVCGVGKYLRVSEGRSLGGKKAFEAGNLLRGTRKSAGEGAGQVLSSLSPAGLQLDSSLTPSLHPSLTPGFHRAPSTEHYLKEESGTIPDNVKTTSSDNQLELVSPRAIAKASREAKRNIPAEKFDAFLKALGPDEGKIFQAFEDAFDLQINSADYPLAKFFTDKLKFHAVEDLCDAIHGYVLDPFRKKNHNVRVIFKDALTVTALASEYRKTIKS